MLWRFLWAGLLVLRASPELLRREKRAWHFNTLLANEELPRELLPQKIGQLNNSHYGPHTVFVIKGEGANTLFTVDERGEIWVRERLDREVKSMYELRAEIRDTRLNSVIEPDGLFYVKVQDINDNPPVFSRTFKQDIFERAHPGSAVLAVSATDKDDPMSINGKIIYKLKNGTEFFKINNITGEITVGDKILDRETQSLYFLSVEASDMPGNDGGLKALTLVTVNVKDINDNQVTFKEGNVHFSVREDEKPLFQIGKFLMDDRDETKNKKPKFTLKNFNDLFFVEQDEKNDGVLTLKNGLDYESSATHSFSVSVTEDLETLHPDNEDVMNLMNSCQVLVSVIDVDEPPVFSQSVYSFSVSEGPIRNPVIGLVSARDPDKAKNNIWYSVGGSSCPLDVSSETGEVRLNRELDREVQELHTCTVTATEVPNNEKSSQALVNIKVKDINDNKPELVNTSNVYICENDKPGTIIGVIGATDKDEHSGNFRFTLAKKSANFSLHDNLNNTASIILTHGGFSTENLQENVLEIQITDPGIPPQTGSASLHIRVCQCVSDRRAEFCKAYAHTGVSLSALLSILLCIITILVIVILFAVRRHYQAEPRYPGKFSGGGDVLEQLVSYDEEGGGEMDTNGYDVSVLSSAFLQAPPPPPSGPALYAVATGKRPPGDMAAMIELKTEEADQGGAPYDTLHVYGYEGPASLAESLSSLEASSLSSDPGYDFLSDWGPRFRTLAELYGTSGYDSDDSY